MHVLLPTQCDVSENWDLTSSHPFRNGFGCRKSSVRICAFSLVGSNLCPRSRLLCERPVVAVCPELCDERQCCFERTVSLSNGSECVCEWRPCQSMSINANHWCWILLKILFSELELWRWRPGNKLSGNLKRWCDVTLKRNRRLKGERKCEHRSSELMQPHAG